MHKVCFWFDFRISSYVNLVPFWVYL